MLQRAPFDHYPVSHAYSNEFHALLTNVDFIFCGVAIIKLHIRKRSLDQQIAHFPNLINECNAKLFKSVVFEPIIWDRLDAAGQTVLPLIAVDVNAFEGIVRHLCEQLDQEEKKLRLDRAFRTLVRPEIVANATSNGKLGRTNRMAFKKLFEAFIKEIHSFLILK